MSRPILVVDDDRAMVETLCDILALKGWAPEGAYSGEEALARVRTRRPVAVLMDIKMGGIDGVETLKRLRAEHPGMNVILMTAYSAAALVEEARTEGAARVLSKPVDPLEVLRLLESLGDGARRLLLLEDNAAFNETLADAMEASGYLVARAATLVEALDHLAHAPVAVVVMDMVLPDVDPADGVASIRRASPGSLFVLYSGHTEILDRTRDRVPPDCLCACLAKPFEVDTLIGVLDDCLA